MNKTESNQCNKINRKHKMNDRDRPTDEIKTEPSGHQATCTLSETHNPCCLLVAGLFTQGKSWRKTLWSLQLVRRSVFQQHNDPKHDAKASSVTGVL